MTPSLSIVIVTWNNAAEIGKAMESCLWPTAPEVIVVHNASTDGTKAVIAGVAACHPGRFRVIENATNIGLGPARNVGVAAATGEYLLFLDGDDWFMPEAHRELETLLQDRPDLAIFNHHLVWPDGHSTAPARADCLSPAGAAASPEDRVRLIDCLSVAWNKAFRREAFVAWGLKFPAGLYEDIPVHVEALARALTITRSPAVLVAYRQRDGSITRSQGAAHGDMLTRLDEVAAFTGRHGDAGIDRAACLLAQRKVLFVLGAGTRLPPELRAPFLRRGLALLTPWRRRAGLPGHDATLLAARLLGACGLVAAQRLKRRLTRRLMGGTA